MKPKVWVKLIFPGVGQLGPGKIALLREIGEARSISAAARAMNMSYRRAWLLVEELNAMFAKPLVVKWHGGTTKGGADLTELGRKVIGQYDTLTCRCEDQNRELLREIGHTAARGRRK